MRKFICISSVPYVVNNGGFRITFQKGDSISAVYTEGDIVHCTTDFGHSFCIQKKDLDKSFEREFDYKEKKYYQQLRDKAAVAAMQGILSNAPYIAAIDDDNEDTIKSIANDALVHANALVNKIKEMDE